MVSLTRLFSFKEMLYSKIKIPLNFESNYEGTDIVLITLLTVVSGNVDGKRIIYAYSI